MIAQPASIREPEIAALVAGAMSVLLRPVGRLAVLRPGDLLWVREPFYLPRAFAHLKPTSAVAAPGCEPVFAADHTPAWFDACRDQLGKRRFARELPKAWHRQHLRVTAIGQVALRELALDDIHAAGWDGRASFEVRWDQDAEFDKYRAAAAQSGAANPQVLRIAFTRVASPLPGYDPRSCAVTQRAQVAARQPAATPAPRMRRFTAPDRTPAPAAASAAIAAASISLWRPPVPKPATFVDALIECHPSLARRQVWCRSCGATQRVENGLRDGWPKCCGSTMTIDSPEEQAALAAEARP